MLIGFRPNPLFEKYGWAPGREWDRQGALAELEFWRRQGVAIVELASDLRATDGAFFRFSDAEWRDLRSLVAQSGLPMHSVLAWRRMLCREPWATTQSAELDRITWVAELFGVKVVTIMIAFPWFGTPGHDQPRRRFRSLTDATEGDFTLAAERLKAYARRLSGFGAALTLEMHDDTLHDTARSALRLREMIGEPNVGVNPDTLDNAWLYPGLPLGDAIAQAREVAPYVNHWHVKQFRRAWSATAWTGGDWILGGAHVDEGDQPIAAMGQAFWDAGFRGAAILESGGGADFTAALRRHVTYLRWLVEEYWPRA